MSTRAPRKSDAEWLQIITKCRQSGLCDAAWCNQHDIPPSTFYKAVTRLRKKACPIPDRSGEISALDLTAPKEPVEIHVVNHPEIGEAVQTVPAMQEAETLHTDNSHMMEIIIGSATIKVSNGLDPVLLQSAIMAAGRTQYAG